MSAQAACAEFNVDITAVVLKREIGNNLWGEQYRLIPYKLKRFKNSGRLTWKRMWYRSSNFQFKEFFSTQLEAKEYITTNGFILLHKKIANRNYFWFKEGDLSGDSGQNDKF